jgi:N-acetylglutamate synthase-like GNAT family acetyltransferase
MDANVQVRRATVEDLPQLSALWQQENLPTADLEKRFKEFQVVHAPDGTLLGAMGLQISGSQARLHSETFAHPEQADELRPKLWERTRLIAGNFGVNRVWFQTAAPYWHGNGFQPAGADEIAKLPAEFTSDASPQPWRYVQLREESVASSIDKEFALLRQAERERTDRMMRQAKVLKMVAAVITVGVLLLALVWAVVFFTRVRPGGLPR